MQTADYQQPLNTPAPIFQVPQTNTVDTARNFLRTVAIFTFGAGFFGACTCWAAYYFGLITALVAMFLGYVQLAHMRSIESLTQCSVVFSPENAINRLRMLNLVSAGLAAFSALLGFVQLAVSIDHGIGSHLVIIIGSCVAVASFSIIGVGSLISAVKLQDLGTMMLRCGMAPVSAPYVAPRAGMAAPQAGGIVFTETKPDQAVKIPIYAVPPPTYGATGSASTPGSMP
jgi:hypothetical protein